MDSHRCVLNLNKYFMTNTYARAERFVLSTEHKATEFVLFTSLFFSRSWRQFYVSISMSSVKS